MAGRVGQYLERPELLERDFESSHLVGGDSEARAMDRLIGSQITHRIVVGPQQGCHVFTLCSRCRRAMRPWLRGWL